jgi:hypothetical protein
MYSGYLFFCNKSSLAQCISRRTFTCTDQHKDHIQKIKRGTVLFMYNIDTEALVGPFTSVTEDAQQIEPGTWATGIDRSSFSGNVTVEWENLHILENALEKFPFLRNPTTCEIPSLTVQELIETLKQAPLYKGEPEASVHDVPT